jgi:SAM-dependent methyltransferase
MRITFIIERASQNMPGKPDWWIDEMASAGPEHLDPGYVVGYDRKSGYEAAEDLKVLQEYGLNKESVVIDLGAGTGVFALSVAPYCKRVIAVEIAPAMAWVIEGRADGAGIDNVDVVQAGMLSYEHQGDPADFVFSRNVLHHLPDFWKALALSRIADMLNPGGLLRLHDLVYSFDPRDTEAVFESWFANAVERAADGYTARELQTHVRTEHSTFSWLLEPMLERAGFEIQSATHRPSRTYSVYDCVRQP